MKLSTSSILWRLSFMDFINPTDCFECFILLFRSLFAFRIKRFFCNNGQFMIQQVAEQKKNAKCPKETTNAKK